jgi:hypothetical protein
MTPLQHLSHETAANRCSRIPLQRKHPVTTAVGADGVQLQRPD